MNSEPTSAEAAPGNSAFPTTQWSMVLNAGVDSSSQSRAALETLCRRYWYPLYGFVRRQGRAHHEAEDCTQEFLSRLLAADGLARARPEHGRFRSFLLGSLRNFLTDEWRRTQTEKRGGGQSLISIDAQEAEDRFAREPVDRQLTPEQAFDRNWAMEMVGRAFAGLRDDYEKTGRTELFRALSPFAWSEVEEDALARLGRQLGITTQACTMALHRLRRRLGERLRADVMETVISPGDVETEVRHLIAAMNAAPVP